MPWLKPEGIYSHLALKDDQSNQVQFRCFMDAVNELEGQGCHFRYKNILRTALPLLIFRNTGWT